MPARRRPRRYRRKPEHDGCAGGPRWRRDSFPVRWTSRVPVGLGKPFDEPLLRQSVHDRVMGGDQKHVVVGVHLDDEAPTQGALLQIEGSAALLREQLLEILR